jgi:hypothetical protein
MPCQKTLNYYHACNFPCDFFKSNDFTLFERLREEAPCEKNIRIDKKNEEVYTFEYVKQNYILKAYDNGNVEMIYYPDGFNIPKKVILDLDFVNSAANNPGLETELSTKRRKLDADGNIILELGDTVSKYQKCMFNSGKRAKKNFYSYALCNGWEYFITLTFADADIRRDIKSVSSVWSEFQRYIKRCSPDAKTLGVTEPHKNGKGFHLHALIGDVDLRLIPGRNNNPESKNYKSFIYSNSGAQIFNLLDWQNGFSTCCIINPEDVQTQVINYCTKYLSKFMEVPHGQKKYYASHNLNECYSYTACLSASEFMDGVKECGLQILKQTASSIIYKNF